MTRTRTLVPLATPPATFSSRFRIAGCNRCNEQEAILLRTRAFTPWPQYHGWAQDAPSPANAAWGSAAVLPDVAAGKRTPDCFCHCNSELKISLS